jgi:hypothetical protein
VLLPSRAPELNPGENIVAIPSSNIPLQSRLRRSRRDHGCRLPSLEPSHRKIMRDNVHRNARLGSHRSVSMTVGFRGWS